MSHALTRWNPLTPIAIATLLVAVAYIGPQPWSPAAATAIALAFAWATGAGRRVTWLALAVGVPTFALLFIMNAVVAPAAPRTPFGPFALDMTALPDALGIALRLSAAVAALGWIIVGIPPRRLTRALTERGLPAWAAYVIVASLEAVPQARRRADEVLDAQRCRGLAWRGGVLGRVRALAPLAGPLIVSLVTESEERSLALDARGFIPGRRRTTLAPIADSGAERAARVVLWLAAVGLLVWGMWR